MKDVWKYVARGLSGAAIAGTVWLIYSSCVAYDEAVRWQAEGLNAVWNQAVAFCHWQTDTSPVAAAWLKQDPLQVIVGVKSLQDQAAHSALWWIGTFLAYMKHAKERLISESKAQKVAE